MLDDITPDSDTTRNCAYCANQARFACDECGVVLCSSHAVVSYGDDDVMASRLLLCQPCDEEHADE
jgi:hypothetical protein